MDEAMQEQLTGLEAVLSELQSPRTSDARKTEIESILFQFKMQQDAWDQCSIFLMHSGDELVQWYSATVFEYCVAKSWGDFAPERRVNAREWLYEYICTRAAQLSAFVRTKLCKVYVDIGKTEWPQTFPEFLVSIMRLLSASDDNYALLGLELIQITSEELSAARGVSSSRRAELRTLFGSGDSIGAVFSSLTAVLTGVYEAAGRPSKAMAADSSFGGAGGDEEPAETPCTSPSGDMLVSGSGGAGFVASDTRKASAALSALTHLFTWVPLTHFDAVELVDLLFAYAALAGDCQVELGAGALAALNELLAKRFVPPNAQDFLLRFFSGVSHLLGTYAGENAAAQAAVAAAAESAPDFVDQMTELVVRFIESHLSRLLRLSDFPLRAFLEAVLQYTFVHAEVDRTLRCLDAWEMLLDVMRDDNTSPLTAHGQIFVLLMEQSLRRSLFAINADQLLMLEDDPPAPDVPSELTAFVNRNADIVSAVAMLLPAEVIKCVLPAFEQAGNDAATLLQNVMDAGGRMPPSRAEASCVVHDFYATSRFFSCLGHLFAEYPETLSGSCQDVLRKALRLGAFAIQNRVWTIDSLLARVLTDAYGVISSCRGFLQRVERFYRSGSGSGGSGDGAIGGAGGDVSSSGQLDSSSAAREAFSQLLAASCELASDGLDVGDDSAAKAAAALLRDLAQTVRAPALLQGDVFGQLCVRVASLSESGIGLSVRVSSCASVAGMLALPWHDAPAAEQAWDARTEKLSEWLSFITQPFGAALEQGGPNSSAHAGLAYIEVFKTLTEVMNLVGNETLPCRRAVGAAIGDFVPIALTATTTLPHPPEVVDAALEFFSIALGTISPQLGADLAREAAGTLVGVFLRDQLPILLTDPKVPGVRAAVHRALDLLIQLVRVRHRDLQAVLPDVVALCLSTLCPAAGALDALEVSGAVLGLVREILVERWTFFAPSAVGSRTGGHNASQREHEAELVQLLQFCIGAFCGQDIVLFKASLELFEELQKRYHLYEQKAFREGGLTLVVEALLCALVGGGHDLLRDDILAAMYHLAETDFDAFLSELLPAFLTRIPALYTGGTVEQLVTQSGFAADQYGFTRALDALLRDAADAAAA